MIICPDEFRVGAWTQQSSARAWEMARKASAQALSTGRYTQLVLVCGLPGSGKSTWARAHDSERTLIWDATALTPRARRQATEIALRKRIPCIAVSIETPLATCMARRRGIVPASKMRQMAHEYIRPTEQEGFDSVTVLS